MAEEFTFELDGRVVQRGRATQQMTAPEPALEYIRSVFPVVPGDVVMTGAGTVRRM
jgi:2-keto-4-pentenoate hydratase/2-oxohepta-3-ene-1,7-dioic acid hydratase in catechol pathway